MTTTAETTAPVRHLSWIDATSVVIGIVIGSGIFMTPALVAMNTSSVGMMMAAWALGGLLCLCGALCYAELSTMHPHAGGEYVYLSRAFGPVVGFLFVWARVGVIQSGAIVAAAYVFGSYATQILSLGANSSMIYALSATVVLTVLNAAGLRTSKWTQNLLTAAKVLGVAGIVVVGMLYGSKGAAAPVGAGEAPGLGAFGLAMVFVLYTFGGWNEAAYVAGEVRSPHRNMLRVMIVSILTLTVLYVAVNFAYLHVLGFEGMRSSWPIASEAMKQSIGKSGAVAVSILVGVSALGATSACIFTGARGIWAIGGDFQTLGLLARRNGRLATPLNAIVLQGSIAVLLILLPGVGESFKAAVDYTAPVFWAFMFMVGLSVFVLRRKNPDARRPFRVPLYPAPMILLMAMCGWMVYSAINYAKLPALAGVGVLAAGVPVYALLRWRDRGRTKEM
jgi:basic amino acid/polyamine antiporter, APA family